MAKGLLKKMLNEQNKEILVASAGVAAMPGFRPTKETIDVMAKHNIDVSTHLTQRLTSQMVDDADLVLVMERMHKEEILNRHPGARKKVFLLREYAEGLPEDSAEINIPDPIAKPMEVYESCFSQIRNAVEKVVQKL